MSVLPSGDYLCSRTCRKTGTRDDLVADSRALS